jgi:two-component system LytT family response regulator
MRAMVAAMANADTLERLPPAPGAPVPRRLREFALGFVYWLVFVLVLEPDNILRALQAGVALPWGHEIARLSGAGLLGGAATPLLLAVVRRLPLERDNWSRRAAAQALGALVGAALLIAVSCLLARWGLGDPRPLPLALGEELTANGPLVVAAVVGLMAIANAARFFAQANAARDADTPPADRRYLTTVPVKTRGRVTLLDLGQVDWIEAQGNYLALHMGAATHLIRESLTTFEARLDPQRFARVHRRTIVAVDRVREITTLGAGDALLRLRDGQELRLSRGYRNRLGTLTSGLS